jgi:hypothetical protein
VGKSLGTGIVAANSVPRCTVSANPAHDMDYLTHHERKFRKLGREIYRLAFERHGH